MARTFTRCAVSFQWIETNTDQFTLYIVGQGHETKNGVGIVWKRSQVAADQVWCWRVMDGDQHFEQGKPKAKALVESAIQAWMGLS